MSQLRVSLLENIGHVQDFQPLLNKLQFGATAFLYSVYLLENLRVTIDSCAVQNLFEYLQDRAIQKDKNGTELNIIFFLRSTLYFGTNQNI